MIAAIFYWLYAGIITELAARYRTSGGSFDFVRRALGEKQATIMAILQLLKLIIANAALALSISSYMLQVGMPRLFQFLCWLTIYGVFTILDSVGVRQSASVQLGATVVCVLLLLFYCVSAWTKFDSANITSAGDFSRDGLFGFFKGLPFALQFFDGFEETPLLMEYAQDPNTTIPRGIIGSYISIAIIAFLILLSGCGVTNIDELLTSEAPLMNGIDVVFGKGLFSDILALLVVLGLLVNFFAFVLFSSQQVQAIAEGGHLPNILSYRHPVHGAPVIASIFCSCVGMILCTGFSLMFDEAEAQNTLVTAALLPAVAGYMLLMECIVVIRKIEDKQSYSGERNTSREIFVLGNDPEDVMRFSFGIKAVRLSQFICALFIVGLLCLASVSNDFLYGVIIIVTLAMVMYVSMTSWILKNDPPPDNIHFPLGETDVDLPSNKSHFFGEEDEIVVDLTNPVHNSYEFVDKKNSSANPVYQAPTLSTGRKNVELMRHNNEENYAVL